MKNASIKNAIKNNIVASDALYRGATEKVALVKSSNEKNGTCTIEFNNFEGNKVKEKDVKVRLFSPGVIDWFPKKGDYVFIKEDLNVIMITGDANHLLTNNKSETSFEKDIFSNLVNDNTGGYII
jgi:hypothetical protein